MRERVKSLDGRKQASEKIHAIKKQVKQQQQGIYKKKLFDCAQKKCIERKRGEKRRKKWERKRRKFAIIES